MLSNRAVTSHQTKNIYTFDDYKDEDAATLQINNTKHSIKLYDEAYDNVLPSDLNKEFMK